MVIYIFVVLKLFYEEIKSFFNIFCTTPAKLTFISLIFLLGIYGYFIRPQIYTNNLEAANFVKLAWSFTFPGLFLGLGGAALMIRRGIKGKEILFLIITLTFALFFLYHKRMISVYPWAMKRYIAVTIPAFALLIAFILIQISRDWRLFGKIISTICIIIIIFIPIKKSGYIIKIRSWYGVTDFFSELVEDTDDKAIFITQREWAAPLEYAYGKKVLYVAYREWEPRIEVQERINQWLDEGKKFYFVSHLKRSYPLYFDFKPIKEVQLKISKLEYAKGLFPTKKNIKKLDRTVALYEITKTKKEQPLQKDEYLVDIGWDDGWGLIKGFDRSRHFHRGARWTLAEAALSIPWFGENVPTELSLRMKGARRENQPLAELSIFINDQPIKTINVENEIKEYRIPINKLIPSKFPNRAILTLKSTTWNPYEFGIRGYPRHLGVLIDWIKVKRIKTDL